MNDEDEMRDIFAGLALQGLLASGRTFSISYQNKDGTVGGYSEIASEPEYARAAYQFAAAMLAERAKERS